MPKVKNPSEKPFSLEQKEKLQRLVDDNLIGYNGDFAKNLRTLMDEGVDGKKLTQQDLAEVMNTTRQAVSQYADGSVQPTIEKIYKLAGIFCVSSDYLLGLTELKSPRVEDRAIHLATGLLDEDINTLKELSFEADAAPKICHYNALKYSRARIISVLLKDLELLNSLARYLFSDFKEYKEHEELGLGKCKIDILIPQENNKGEIQYESTEVDYDITYEDLSLTFLLDLQKKLIETKSRLNTKS